MKYVSVLVNKSDLLEVLPFH